MVVSALIQCIVYSTVMLSLNYWILLIFFLIADVRIILKNNIENDIIPDLKKMDVILDI
jgi:hypothetical protein